jgi:hypothetical protein
MATPSLWLSTGIKVACAVLRGPYILVCICVARTQSLPLCLASYMSLLAKKISLEKEAGGAGMSALAGLSVRDVS